MPSRPIELALKVKADASQAPAGLKPATDALTKVQKGAEQTTTAIKQISKTPVSLTVHDEAIAKSRARIKELQDEIAKKKTLDINADTADAEKEIRRLESGIKVLTPKIPVDADTAKAEKRLAELKAQVITAKKIDVNADVSKAEAEIAALEAQLSKLAIKPPKITADVNTGSAVQKVGIFSNVLEAASSHMDRARQKAEALNASLSGLGIGGNVSELLGLLKGTGPALAGGAVAAGAFALQLGKMAADAETAQVAWKGILQNADQAKKVVADLRGFAAGTPFDFETVDKAAKTLAAFGVSTDDLIPLLTKLGDTASAVNAPLDQVARAYGQMVAKGKVSNEELLQLTDAGVPAQKKLAEALGVTVEQLQDMASKGELGADKVKLLGDVLGDTFKGSMSDQAKTFNGQLSNLNDNLTQLGQTLGLLVLPEMKDLLSIANGILGPIQSLANGLANLETEGSAVGEVFSTIWSGLEGALPVIGQVTALAGAFDIWNGSLDDTAASTDKAASSTANAQAQAQALAQSTKDAADKAAVFKFQQDNLNTSLEKAKADLEAAKQSTDQYFASLGQGTADQDAFTRSVQAFGESVKENGKKFEGNSKAALDNRDALRDVASSAGQLLGSMHEQGASTEEVTNKMGVLRQQFIDTAKAMGVPQKEAEELANKYGLIPKDVETKLKAEDAASGTIAGVQTKLNNLNGKTSTVNIGINVTAKYNAIDRATGEAVIGGRSLARSFSVPTPVLPPSPEVAGYGARASAAAPVASSRVSVATTALPVATRTYNITVNVDRGAPTAEVGRTIVDQIRAFERAAGKGWRN